MTILQDTQLPLETSPQPQTFITSDGVQLFFRHWPATAPSKKAIFLFHRGHEHSGRFQGMVEELSLSDFHVFAWDARGHGQSPGERGYAPSVSRLIKDIDEFVRFVSVEHDIPIENMVVLGHSVAAVLVSAWVHDYAPPIRAMVLGTPALRIKLYIPFAMPGLRLWQKIRGKAFIKSYVKAKMLTHDPECAQEYENDPLISRSIAVNVLLGLHDLSTRIMNDAGAIETPTLMLAAGSDWVVKNCAQARFFQRLGSREKQMHLYPGFYHAIFHEKDRHLVVSAVREFVQRAFRGSTITLDCLTPSPGTPGEGWGEGLLQDEANDPHPNPLPAYREREQEPERRKADLTANAQSLICADKAGYTKREYDRLCAPLPMMCPSRLSFLVQKIGLKTVATLSQGIRLGWRTGFDSGQSLDYVYENRPRGITPLGKLIDFFYLNSIGWRGIRVRKANIERAILQAIERMRQSGEKVRILDIAAGPGRYLLDVLKKCDSGDVNAVLRDRNVEALAAGRELAAALGVTNATYEPGDAFDPDAIAKITPRLNIAIVSGLYELFPDNAGVLASLKGLSQSIANGGYLIYTNQPWHPQLEMIARVLINREHRPWIMRRRTQAEMDELVRSVGFEKIGMDIDEFGIFTVSVARRIET